MAFEGTRPNTVIDLVKFALWSAAAQSGKDGLAFALGSVTLEMTAVQTIAIGGGLTLKIPYVDWELGLKKKIAEEKTQTIAVTVVPAGPEAREAAPIDIPLANALLDIDAILRDAAASDPKLDLKEAAVTLQFVVKNDDSLELLGVEAARSDVTTHKLTVGLVPPK